MAKLAEKRGFCTGTTDGRKDGRTDGRTEVRTDKALYGVACPQLKRKKRKKERKREQKKGETKKQSKRKAKQGKKGRVSQTNSTAQQSRALFYLYTHNVYDTLLPNYVFTSSHNCIITYLLFKMT